MSNKLVYGFPTIGKTTVANSLGLFDTDYLLGKLDSKSRDEKKEQVAAAATILRDNGFGGVTNLLNVKPDIGFVRTDPALVRELMIKRGDDRSLVAALNIESWIESVLTKFDNEWYDVPLINLGRDRYLSDFIEYIR